MLLSLKGKKFVTHEKQLLQRTESTIFQALVSALKRAEQRFFSVESHSATHSSLQIAIVWEKIIK